MISQKDKKALLALMKKWRAEFDAADAAIAAAIGDRSIAGAKFDRLLAARAEIHERSLGARDAISEIGDWKCAIEMRAAWGPM